MVRNKIMVVRLSIKIVGRIAKTEMKRRRIVSHRRVRTL